MTLNGSISTNDAQQFGISISTSLSQKTNINIKQWKEILSQAINSNTTLHNSYKLDLVVGYNFIRVNLRYSHSWNLIKTLIFIQIKETSSYSERSHRQKPSYETSIIVGEKQIFLGSNLNLAERQISILAARFLREYTH